MTPTCMVAALSDRDFMYEPESGRFVLHLYNSKHETWTTTIVSVEDHQLQQHLPKYGFMHANTKVISIGGDDDTVGFVDLWRSILVCDLRRVLDHPKLRYIPFPQEIVPDELNFDDDPRLSRDIAVVNGRIKLVREGEHWNRDFLDCYLVEQDDVFLIRGYLDNGLSHRVNQWALPNATHTQLATVFFMVKEVHYDDAKAWVVAVDMKENKLEAVSEFDAEIYTIFGFAYLHSRLPWILLETQAYVADRVNATTACTFSRCGKHVQVTLCVDRPPRVSYLCVFCRAAADDDDERPEQMIGCAPDVIATEGDLVLLSIVVGTRKPTKRYEADLYVYRPGGPSLSLLPRAPQDQMFGPSQIGFLTFHDGSSSSSSLLLGNKASTVKDYYMVAALCEYIWSGRGGGRFMLYLYNSKHET
ncbi:hypothetical protein PR202_ga02450 [Eleusine coracana subsp. coracana]|uniref:DUF1618 domain-containing protein n=1 Tax=Eleusine coracana subsp. coracana TaxID=191504 RepID=A0AAV5BJH8_ELECO|nr:hypothetical protein PR202_ga02450 [Eleusine coracana subsp. coracana]